MSAAVNEQAILDALRQIPEGRWPEVLHYLESIGPIRAPIRTAAEMAESDLIGLWADREDLGPTSDFADQMRHESESSQG